MYNRYIAHSDPRMVEEPVRRERVPEEQTQAPVSSGIVEGLRSLLSRLKGRDQALFSGIPLLESLDAGDILLILVLIFLFRESEDEEWLIILALVLLMGL